VVRLTLRLPDDLHDKIRWLSYRDRRSMQEIMIELLQKALVAVEVPKEESR